MTRLFEAKPFIIAEVGSNWTTLPECLASIAAAKRCGADAVKFQLFNHAALYGWPIKEIWDALYRISTTEAPVRVEDPEMEHSFPVAWLPKLADMAKSEGIEFMCTAFSPELVQVVDPYVSVHKIASSDATWPQLLDAVAKTGKPILLSLGAKRDTDRIATFFRMRQLTERTILLHCVANYPADFFDLSLFDGRHNEGLSDHTLGYSVAVAAANNDARVIEKHFTAFPDLDTPDRPHSLNPTQFKRMVDLIRGTPVETEEGEMYARHCRRLIATTDVKPGEYLKYGVNFGSYRSLVDDTRGASPFDWEKVNGRVAKGEIGRGKGIGLGDVE